MNDNTNLALLAPELDPHPNVIGTAVMTSANTIQFDGRKYRSTGKDGHSMHDSTPVTEFRDFDGRTIWLDPLGRVHADDLEQAREYRQRAVTQGAHEPHAAKVHRVHHTRLKAGDALYDAQGREVDAVLYFTGNTLAGWHTVHTRAGFAHATQGGYLLGLSNQKPA